MTKQSEAVPAKPNQPKFEDNYSEAAYFAGITITQAIQCDLALRDLRAGVPLPWHTVHANPNVDREMADELLRLSDVVCEEDAAIIETLLKKAGVL